MLTTAEDYLNLVTVNKDVELGKYVPDYSMTLFRNMMETRIGESVPLEICQKIFDAIFDQLDKTETINITNIEVHFAIKASSMVQYVSPYNKNYNIGSTKKFIHEKVIWSYRPDAVHIGYINENTYTDKNGKRENNSHKFGSVDDVYNIIVLHTHEKTNTAKEHGEFSTIHIAILYPVGEVFFREISELYHQRNAAKRILEERRKENMLKSRKKKIPKIKKRYRNK